MTHAALNHTALTDAEHLRLYGLDATVCDNIRRHRPFILTLLPDVLDRFYARLLTFAEARRLLRDDAHVAHVKSMQLRHWQRLTEGRFDEDYARMAIKVGETHFNAEVPPKLYIAFYNVLLIELANLIAERYATAFPDADATDRFDLMKDLTCVLMYDMECAITVYVERANSIFI